MRAGLWALALTAAVAGAPAIAADPLPQVFGTWRGMSVAAEGIDPAALQPGDLDITLAPATGGFRAQWTALERAPDGSLRRQAVDARFAATGRPGVYAFESDPGPLLARLFASPATGNPLDGETLLWARIEDATLHLYSLVLHPNGGFDLDRWAHTPEDDGLRRVLTRRTETGAAVVEGRLDRQNH
jgi:hypothetical protein